MRTAALVAFLALPLAAGAVAEEIRLTGGIVDSTKTSTGVAPTVGIIYRVDVGSFRLAPSASWSAARKEYGPGGSGNWTGAFGITYSVGKGRVQPMFGVGASYIYTDSATWTKKVTYGSAHGGVRIYFSQNHYKGWTNNGRNRDYTDLLLTCSYELTSTYANDTRACAFGASLNEHFGNGGWFFVTEGSIGWMRFHPNPYDSSWMDSGTVRVAIGFMHQ
jgi:hypothetical protein